MFFRHRPFSLVTQLQGLITFVVGLAVLTMGMAWINIQNDMLYEQLKEHITSQAGVIEKALQPAFSVGDTRLMDSYIDNFTADVDLLEIAIYEADGRHISGYHRFNVEASLPLSMPSWQRWNVLEDELQYKQSIELNGVKLGSLVMCHSLDSMKKAYQYGIYITLLAAVVSILLALLIATIVQRIITEPIARLSTTMNQLVDVELPDLNLHGAASREITQLFDGFRNMITRLKNSQKEAEEQQQQLRESEERWRSIVALLPVPLIISRRQDGKILECNDVFRSMLKLAPTSVIDGEVDLSVLEFYRDITQREALLEKLSREGVVRSFPVTVKVEGRKDLEMLASLTAISFKGEDVLLTTLIDISEEVSLRHQMEKTNAGLEVRVVERTASLHLAKQEAEAANRKKTEFLAAISHDLRQPLYAMTLYLDILSGLLPENEQQDILEKVQLSSKSLNDLLNDLLEFNKLDSGSIAPILEEVDVAQMLERLYQEWLLPMREKGLELRLAGKHIVPLVQSDSRLLYRMLNNLLANALRYTERGGVLIGCRYAGGALRLGVWDTGCGIKVEHQERIFDAFYQVDNPERDSDKGIGLGLAIVKSQADLLGYSIYMRSHFGGGSCLAIDVPLIKYMPLQGSKLESYEMVDLTSFGVLIIEDDAMIRIATGQLLTTWGMDVVLADSGNQALDAVESVSRKPQLIIADYRLRENETGLEVVAAVRQKLGTKVPAIIITGEFYKGLPKRCESSNCTLLRKPIDGERLKKVVSALLQD